MDARQLNQALDAAFATWIGRHEAVTLYRSVRDSCKVLARFASLQDAVAFLRDGTSDDYQTKETLLRAFVEVHQA